MAPACTLVALVSLLSPVVAEERQTTAAQALAQAIEVQDICQSFGRDCDYGLELLQKQVSRRAAPTGLTKHSSSAALPPAVAPELLETISDLGVEVHTGEQRTAGFGLIIEDIQDGLEKAIDVVDEVSASQRKSLKDIKGRSLSVDSAMKTDLATKNAEVEAQLAKLAGDAHLRANRIAEKVKDVQRQFQDLSADLNQIQLGDQRVGDLSEGKESMLVAGAAAANAMQQAIKSGDRMRAEEDLQREKKAKDARQQAMTSPKRMKAEEDLQREMRQAQLARLQADAGTKRAEKQVTTAAAAVKSASDSVEEMLAKHSDRAVGISHALDDATTAMKARYKTHTQEKLKAKPKETAAKKDQIDLQQKAAMAAKEEAVVRDQERAPAELYNVVQAQNSTPQEAFPVAEGESRILATTEAVEVAAKVVSAPWVEAVRRVDEIMGAATDDVLIGTADAKGSVAAVQRQPATTTNSEELSNDEDLADSAAQEAVEAPAATAQEEAEVAAASAAVDEAQKRVDDQLKHHKDAYPSVVEPEEGEDFQKDDTEMTPEEVAEDWMDDILQGEGKKIAEIQKKPSVSRAEPFFEQQRRAAAAADQVREAAAQTQHEEEEVQAAVEAVEEARDRVTRRLVNHEDLNPTPKPEKDDTMLTPEEVAEKWMDSIIQSGQIAGMEAE